MYNRATTAVVPNFEQRGKPASFCPAAGLSVSSYDELLKSVINRGIWQD